MPKIGLALSGGGHRASLFALGVLLYLTDVQKNRDVVSVASVSGGSITNGYFAQVRGYHNLDSAKGLQYSQKFAKQLAFHGTLWASLLTWAYLVTTIVFFALVIGFWGLPLSWPSRFLVFLVGLAAWHKLLAEKRGVICDWAYATTLYNKGGTATKLRDIETEINHVFCATDLHAGEHVYFGGDFVYAYHFGLGQPADLPLSTAVQVSAAFPGGFPPRVIRTAQHHFEGGRQQHASVMVLTDGGVYDNMGEQWAVGLQQRKERVPFPQFKEVEELIVVNSSAKMPWRSLTHLRIPLLGELFGLLEVVTTLYDNTTRPRRTALVQRFDAAAQSKVGMTGVLITIDQTPFNVANYFKNSASEPERSVRAKEVLNALSEHPEDDWKALVRASGNVATTLRKLGQKVASQLIYHAYVVANTNCHVILDYPLLPIPTAKDFERRIFGG